METYKEFINNILETRGRFACGEEYHERHHIVPRCMGGTDGKDNLIDLFAREHFIAHRLLVLENPDNDKLIYAWNCMAHMENQYQERYEITAEEYEELKIAQSKALSKMFKGRIVSEETKQKQSKAQKDRMKNPENCSFYGKHHSEESKRILSENHKGLYDGEKNPMYGISPKERMDEETYELWKKKCTQTITSLEVKEKQRLSCLGKPLSEEHKKKISNSLTGKKHSEETKKKIGDASKGRSASEETKEKMKRSHPHISVRCVETGVVYISSKEAERQTKIGHSNILKAIKNNSKAGGYHWEVAYEQDLWN